MNQSAREKVSIYKKNSGAEGVRYIEYDVVRPAVSGYELTAERANQIFQPLQENYGHAMPMYIKHLLQMGNDSIVEIINRWKRRALEDIGDNAEFRFIHADFAVSFAGAEIANAADIIKIDIEATYQYMLKRLKAVINKYITIELDYESILGEFINSNLHNMLAIKDGKVAMEPRGQLWMRADADKGTLHIAKTPLKDFLSKGNSGIAQFERVLTEAGVMTSTGKKVRLGTGWKAATGITSVNAYEFSTDLSSVIPDAQEKAATGTDTD